MVADKEAIGFSIVHMNLMLVFVKSRDSGELPGYDAAAYTRLSHSLGIKQAVVVLILSDSNHTNRF